MAESEAEAAFFSSMQAANENAEGYNIEESHSGEQIESSDEYDPAQDVQDISLPDQAQASPFVESPITASCPTSTNPIPSLFPVPNSASDHRTIEDRPTTSNSIKSPISTANPIEASTGKEPGAASTISPRSATFKPRLPNDTIGILEDRIKEDEKGDIDAWLSLINEHRRRGKLDDMRKVYERFFMIFPQAVCIQRYV